MTKKDDLKQERYDALVAECKKLRAKAEVAGAEFFLFLMRTEAEKMDLLQEFGCETIDFFINSNHLCKVDRYHLFKRGVERTSVEDALKYGASWTMANGHDAVSDQVTQALRQRAEEFVETMKVAPSEETVKTWRAEASPPRIGPSKQAEQRSEVERLRAENQALRAKLKAAEKRISDLEKEIARKKPVHPQPRA